MRVQFATMSIDHFRSLGMKVRIDPAITREVLPPTTRKPLTRQCLDNLAATMGEHEQATSLIVGWTNEGHAIVWD